MKKIGQNILRIIGAAVLAVNLANFAAHDSQITRRVGAEPLIADQSKPELVAQTGHNSSVNAVVFDPNNRWLATAGTDSAVIVWETATGRELRALQGHQGAVRALAVSPDGRLVASGGSDKLLKLWDVRSGRELRTLSGHESMIETISFAPDGKSMASGGADHVVVVWDVDSGQARAKLSEHTAAVKSVAFSPNSLVLASGGADRNIKIWDVKKQRAIKTIKNAGLVTALRFAADGEQLASGNAEATVKIWNTVSGKEIAALKGHQSKVLTLFFDGDEKLLSVGDDRTIKRWNLARRAEIESKTIETANASRIESAALSEDGRFLAIGNGDRSAAVYQTADGAKLNAFENQTFGYYCAAFSADGRWFAAGSLDNSIKLWDLETGQGLPPLKGHSGDLTAIAFHPDNQRLISSSMDGTIRIWNLVTGAAPQVIKAHNNYVTSLAVSKNGRFIVSGSLDRTVKIWNAETGNEIYDFKDYPGAVASVAVSPDERLIAAGGADKTVKLWDAAARKPLLVLSGHTKEIETVAFSPDGRLLASGSDDQTVKIWDAATGRCVRTLTGHSGKVNDLFFSPDGNYLASAGQDKTIRFWSVAAGSEERVLSGHNGAVKALSFSPDGKWLASGSDDGSVIVRRGETGESVATLLSLRDGNDWLVVTPQGIFDGSPEAWNRLIWRFDGDTFNTQPVEVFFNEFYYPGLLSDLLGGKSVPKKIDISKKDRRQPRVKIERLGQTDNSARTARVKIEVMQAAADGEHRSGSGARDVRIFRNGSLVKLWDGDVLKGAGDRAVLEATIPLVAGQNQITAYAFNHDNIKSSDFTLNIDGAASLKRKGTLYIVGIAVGKNANPNFSLKNIDLEAVEFARRLSVKQSELEQFERVEIVALLNEAATRQNILTALKAMTRDAADKSSVAIPDLAKLKPAQPEDTVLVYFTGHGTSQNNHFYMLPFDLGATNPARSFDEQLKTILDRSISDLDLREIFKDIDANRLLLIIDACNSGQIIESEEKRQGPINAKGLAQLAFDKGMFILTASQSEESAYVSQILKRSYLTYALIEDGLKSPATDAFPVDGKLSLKEWFDYAVTRVPQLRETVYEKVAQNEKQKGVRESSAVSTNAKEKRPPPKTQSPRAFYRRQIELEPMIVARVGGGN